MKTREDGYAMAALLAAMASMAIMLAAAMPVWKTTATREKEAELIFRGEEYVRAIGRFQRRTGALPPSIDALIDGKYLRKKYKDPITNDDFQPLSAGQAAGIQGAQGVGGRGQQGQQQPQQAAGRAGGGFQLANPGGGGGGGFQLQAPAGALGQAGPVAGGIIGVVSKSTETSFRLYNNRQRYNEWAFVFTQQTLAPGQGGVNQGQPGPRGGQPGPRGGRGGVDGRGNPGGRGGQGPAGQGANPFGGQSPFGGRPAAPPAGQQPPPPRPRF
jgi:type II secretory pathway pseudopilin PulG